MRAHTIISKKTCDLSQVINYAKSALAIADAKPIDILKDINDKFLKPAGVRMVFDNKEIPLLIYKTDKDALGESGDPLIDCRMLLTCDRASRNHQIELASECNGVVVDPSTWDIISYPPAALSFNMQKNAMIDCLKSNLYKIYYADFGSVITLYYYGSRWRISTANSYQIDDLIWIGTKTYRELINELMENIELDIEELDKDWCYSFGFHHPEYHKFNGATLKPIRAWFIRAINIVDFNKTGKLTPENTTENNGIMFHKIPKQKYADDIMAIANIDPAAAIKKMEERCAASTTNYFSNPCNIPLHGFILKSIKPDVIADTLIESDLQCKLRQMISQRPPISIPIEKRFDWMMINSSFSIENKVIFRKLFPHTVPFGEQLDQLIRKISSRIVDISNKPDIVFENNNIDKVAQFIIEQMSANKIEVNRKPKSIGIIQDFLQQQEYIEVYIKLLF